MAPEAEQTGLRELEDALARGDMRGVRRVLFELTPKERDLLEARLGAQTVARLYENTRRAARAGLRGKVVVIHGIMGGRLDVVSNGSADRVWLNYFRLFLGRIADLRLAVKGEKPPVKVRVKVGGILPEYLPTITELATQWDVLPFAYDWRDDLDKAADDLAARIKAWRNGKPVHLVAHSMGGLVSRWFIRKYPDLWKQMQDPSGMQSGGRLIMLGTPNRGSLTIPLVLTGEERTVKLLETCDVKHDMPELLDILGTFLGCYEMLPSPRSAPGDDRGRLWDETAWGTVPVRASHLARAKEFHETLSEVLTPERLVYIAGYDQTTPYRIRVDKPGKFSYQETRDGDGRVPHELGLLEGVSTLWVNEAHGDLHRNAAVLDGIHGLLATGDTDSLEHSRPISRAARADTTWRPASEVDTVPEEVLAAIAKPVSRGVKGAAPATPEEGARIERELVAGFVGAGTGGVRGPALRPSREITLPPPSAPRKGPAKLEIEVVWGELTKVEADVYVCGHYENIPPQGAEKTLDRVVTLKYKDESGGMLTNLTRRGILRGSLGDVYFYQWAQPMFRHRVAAIAGMGRPGAFGPAELRSLARNLTMAVSSLPRAGTICSVLIGSGVGNMSVETAVRGLIEGMASALPSVEDAAVRTLRIVDRDLTKAVEIQRCLAELIGDALDPKLLKVRLAPEVTIGEMDEASETTCLMQALAAAATAAKHSTGPQVRALDALLAGLPISNADRARTRKVLKKFAPARDGDVRGIARRLKVSLTGPGEGDSFASTRISFVSDSEGITATAISGTAVIPLRNEALDEKLLQEAIRDMTNPKVEDVPALSLLLTRFVLPRDFRDLLKNAGQFIFEVDRKTARIHWEMIAKTVDASDPDAKTVLSLTHAVARQLRTSYSPPPAPDQPASDRRTALVVGDPGDPDQGLSLPGACEEAIEIANELEKLGVKVDRMIGAPDSSRDPRVARFPPASRLNVLNRLMQGGYDILHYAGHGAFDDKAPDTAGWLFKGGILSSRELERIDLAPRLIVANACLSGMLSDATKGGQPPAGGRSEAELLPGLADEFFRRGVRNYIGTAWPIDDLGAIEFAKTFYRALLGKGTTGTIGDALLAARKALFDQRAKFGSLWAAYQHYGDPLARLDVVTDESAEDPGAEPDRSAKSPTARGAAKRQARRSIPIRKRRPRELRQ